MRRTTTTAQSLLHMQKTSKTMLRSFAVLTFTFMNPFLALTNEEIMTKRLVEEIWKAGIPEDEIREAAHAGWLEMQNAVKISRKRVRRLLNI